MTLDLADYASERGVKYFMISYTDLFGTQRAKIVPAQAIAEMQKDGAGFAGFRHSDTVAVTETGIEMLTFYPRDLESLTIAV